MAKQWTDIRSQASGETLRRAGEKTEAMLALMDLAELREDRGLTQEQVADRLGTRQSNVSRLERRENLQIRTLREVVEALGGELEVTAKFPDGTAVRISTGEGT